VPDPFIAFNALNLRPGVHDGAATVSVNLLAHLPEVLPEARFVIFLQEGELRVPEHERVRVVHRRRFGPLARIAFETLLLSRELRRMDASALIAPFESIPFRPPCPVIVIAQNLLYHAHLSASVLNGLTRRERLLTGMRHAYYSRRMPSAYERAARVVAVSHAVAQTLERRAGLDPARTHVVQEGSDSILLPKLDEQPKRDDSLLVVSALAPYKNLEATLEVFRRLRADDGGLRLTIAGANWRGYERVLLRLIDENGLGGHVDLLGAVDPTTLVRLYGSSRALLLLSECEAFGLPALEAMRYGLPVVVADRGALPEVVGDAGVIVEPDDLTATTERVRALLRNTEELARRAAKGRERAAMLTWRATAEGIAAVVREVLRG
jgi:glycosyltransferase involved in cell wall biosynthesis